jgi:hypothetical protein
MTLSAFGDKTRPPQEDEVVEVLGRSQAAWRCLREDLAKAYPPLVEEWIYPSRKWGWTLRLKRKKRAIVYLTPHERYFVAGTALGERAVAAALTSDLPDEVRGFIENAQRFAEGRAFRVEVRTKKDAEVVEQVLPYKMST